MKSSRLLCALLAVLVLLCGCEKEPPPPEEPEEEESHIATLLAMDTVMKLTVYGPDGQTAADRASARWIWGFHRISLIRRCGDFRTGRTPLWICAWISAARGPRRIW